MNVKNVVTTLHERLSALLPAAGGLLIAVALAFILHKFLKRRRSRHSPTPPTSAAAQTDEDNPDPPESGDTASKLISKPLSRRTKTIAAMATVLSLDGMFTVFSAALHFPWIATVAACGTIDFAGYEFANQTREERLADRPGTWQLFATWTTVLASSSLSATAALVVKHQNTKTITYYPTLEAVVRFIIPIIAMLMILSWMLPKVVEVSLTKRQEARWAWAFHRTQLFEQRASWFLTKWIGKHAHRWARDRIAHRSLQQGNVSVVYKRAERQALATMLTGFDGPTDTILDDLVLNEPAAGPDGLPGQTSRPDNSDDDTKHNGAPDSGPDRTPDIAGHNSESDSQTDRTPEPTGHNDEPDTEPDSAASGHRRPDSGPERPEPNSSGHDTEPDTEPDGSGHDKEPDEDEDSDTVGISRGPQRPKPASARGQRPVPKPAGSGDGKLIRAAPIEQLEQVCRDWAKDNNRDPKTLIRAEVQGIVKSAGYSCSTERAQSIQDLLDPVRATDRIAVMSGNE